MCYLSNSIKMAKINQAVCRLFTFFCISILAVGCTNHVAGNTANGVAVVKKPQIDTQQQVVVINKPRKTAGVVNRSNKAKQSVKNHSQVKDQHHIEYDKKRMRYNQQWLARQEAEERQRIQRLQYQRRYEKKLREQEQLAKRQQRQQSQQSMMTDTNGGQQIAALSQYQQRQAEIEARQQQHNWRQDGGWDQAQIQARQRAQQQRIRQQHQQRWQYQQRLQQQRQRQQRAARAWHGGANLAERLSNAAIARTYHKVHYDGRYIPISYPMGDVPANIGVCTDTLIRSYRRLGIDLQQLVHEDISRAFHVYPNLPKWGLSAPDPNIDHRRVHNLKVFFSRHGQRLPVTNNPADYRPGDIVTWHLGGDQEHIGLVVNRRSPEDPRRHMIVHNIAKGDRMEDILFKLPITGHYRYLPNRSRWMASR